MNDIDDTQIHFYFFSIDRGRIFLQFWWKIINLSLFNQSVLKNYKKHILKCNINCVKTVYILRHMWWGRDVEKLIKKCRPIVLVRSGVSLGGGERAKSYTQITVLSRVCACVCQGGKQSYERCGVKWIVTSCLNIMRAIVVHFNSNKTRLESCAHNIIQKRGLKIKFNITNLTEDGISTPIYPFSLLSEMLPYYLP